MDGNVLEMDGNVLEMVCPKLLCIGIGGGCGVVGSFLSSQLRCVCDSPARCPLPGTPGGHPSLQRQRSYLPGGLISLYQSPPLICVTAGTSSIHANRGISLKPNLVLDCPGWSPWVFAWMCAPGQAVGQLSQGCGGAAHWDHGARFPSQPLPHGRKRSPAWLQALPTSSCSAASMDPSFPATQYV